MSENQYFVSDEFGEITSSDFLENLSGVELVRLYNEIASDIGLNQVKKFKNRETALERTTGALEKWAGHPPEEAEKAEQAEEKPKKKSKERERLNLPVGDSTGIYRPNTRRGKVVSLASRDKGATIDELLDATEGWGMDELMICLRHVNSYLGYGVEETEDGTVFITGDIKSRKPINYEPDDSPKTIRAGTKRARTFNLLSRTKGATVEEVMDECNWNYVQALEGIKLLHIYSGYGLSEDDEGKIRIVRA